MTLVFIENTAGGSQMITVLEKFGGASIEHRLAPGENLRIAASRFKSIVIDESAANKPAIVWPVAVGAAS